MPQARQLTRNSSNTTLPVPKRTASMDRSVSTNEAPRKSNTGVSRVASSAKPTRSATSSTWYTDPVKWSSVPLVYTVNLNTVLDFFHLRNFKNASSEESIFFHTLYCNLFTQARLLAAILPWSVQRPLQALREAMSAPARNYSVRSAKRKRPSNSQAASRKRSSGA